MVSTKNYERLGTLDELKVRFGEEDPIGCAKQYIAERFDETYDKPRNELLAEMLKYAEYYWVMCKTPCLDLTALSAVFDHVQLL